MNRVLAQTLLVIGIILLAFGGYQIATNQPRTFTPSQDQSLGGAFANLGNAMSIPFENQKRADARKSATMVLVLGAIVGGIGGVGLASAKKVQ
jgi:hypothetical protein